MANNKHHYLVEAYPNGWALGRCKWCRKVKPMRNWPVHDAWGKVLPTTAKAKRDFLRSLNITIHASNWEPEEKIAIINSVKQIGIQKTAKKYELAASTVGLWAKGLSPNAPNATKYSPKFKEKMIIEYQKEPNFYKLSKKTGIPRATIQNWVKNTPEVLN